MLGHELATLKTLVESIDALEPAVVNREPNIIADYLNYREPVATANPDPQGTVYALPDSVVDIMAVPAATEKASIMGTTWATLASATYATNEGACDLINAWLVGIGKAKETHSLSALISEAIDRDNGQIVLALLTLMESAGIITATTKNTLVAGISLPDPAWRETLYTYDNSIAMDAGLPRVTVDDVGIAMQF